MQIPQNLRSRSSPDDTPGSPNATPLANTFLLGILVGGLTAIVTLSAIEGSGITPPHAILAVGGVLSALMWNQTSVRE